MFFNKNKSFKKNILSLLLLPILLLLLVTFVPDNTKNTQIEATLEPDPSSNLIEEEKSEIISNVILVKLKKESLPKLKGNPSPTDTGIEGLNEINESLNTKDVKQLTSDSSAVTSDSDIDQWLKVTIDEEQKIIKDDENAEKIMSAVAKFDRDENVEKAQPNYVYRTNSLPNDTYLDPDQSGNWKTGSWGQSYEDLWGLKKIKADEVWQTNQGENVVVGVVDSGVFIEHEDISENIFVNTQEIANNGIDDDNNGFIDDVSGWNFVENNNNPDDNLGHGTHVSGTIAAAGNNEKGISGVAPKAKVLPVKSLNDNGFGTSDWLASGIRFAADSGADIINNSWGCGYCPNDLIIEDAVVHAHGQDVVLIFAAGNISFRSFDIAVATPQNLPETISVAATDNNDQKSTFSKTGQLVDVAAPGSGIGSDLANILSLSKSGSAFEQGNPQNIVSPGYLRIAGTSMSAPHVSGLAAIIRSHNPQLTNEQIRQVLRLSADDVEDSGFDIKTGYGRINAASALNANSVLTAKLNSPRPNSNIINLESIEVTGTVSGPDFANYNLSYGIGFSPNEWITINDSSSQVVNGNLGVWQTRSLTTNWYTLKITATDNNGQKYDSHITLFKESAQLLIPNGDLFSQPEPDISGNVVVWQERTEGYLNIFLYNISTQEETQITNTQVHSRNPKIDGDLVVWAEPRFGKSDIFLYNISTQEETQITSLPSSTQIGPDVSGNRIVWIDNRNGNSDIYMFNLETHEEIQITSDITSQSTPKISGNNIVWYQDDIFPSRRNIYYYNVNTKTITQLTHHSTDESSPNIYGSKIVWEDKRHGNIDIYMYDLITKTETNITNNPSDQLSPVIFGPWIAWVDFNERNPSIMSHNLISGETEIVSTNLLNQIKPAITNHKLVWQDLRDGIWNIYTQNLPNNAPIITIKNADVNGSGQVTMDDILEVVDAYGSNCEASNLNPVYDLNNDCIITMADIFSTAKMFGRFWPPHYLSSDNIDLFIDVFDPDEDETTYFIKDHPLSACFNGQLANQSAGTCDSNQFTLQLTSTLLGTNQIVFEATDGDLTTTESLIFAVLDPSEDTDLDSFSNEDELSIGTDPTLPCSPNASHASWAPDFDNNNVVNIQDILTVASKAQTTSNQPTYLPRYDLNTDLVINSVDVYTVAGFFGPCPN